MTTRTRRRRPLASVSVALAVVALVGFGFRWAVDNTLTRHSSVDRTSSMLVTIRAERQEFAEHDEDELVEALIEICQLEVGPSSVDDSVRLVDGSRDLYEVLFRPAMDGADQRQLRGCLEDLRIDHFRAFVEAVEYRET